MKTTVGYFVFAIFSFLTFSLLAGCSTPQFGNARQYDEENWHFLADPGQVARMRQDKLRLEESRLALEKLKATPALTKVENGVNQGFYGKIFNSYRREMITVNLSGPEKKSYTIAPLGTEEDYLLPGAYLAEFFVHGYKRAEWKFSVGPNQYKFLSQVVHWGLLYDP